MSNILDDKHKKNRIITAMTQPICPYFKRCGGCLYQDMSPKEYALMKQHFILRAFSDKGLTPEIEEIRQVPIGSRRRASFSFETGKLGFNGFKSHTVIDIQQCPILTPALSTFLPKLKSFVSLLSGKGDVFVQESPFGLDIHIHHGTHQPTLAFLEQAAIFAQTHPIARLIYNHTLIVEKTKLPFPPDAFLQPSEAGEKILIDLMLSFVGESRTAVDLFCGTGTFTHPLLEKGLIAHGYDCTPESVQTLGRYGVVRDLFRNPLSPEELKDIDLVVMDPPRAGAKAQTENLALSNVHNIILISCNPTTAARDANILIGAGFRMGKITPVDQFTFSNHIEIVCNFQK